MRRILTFIRMKRLIKEKEELDGQRSDEEQLNVHEKEEGDLFGIRALEAGFYGGVTQSLPASLASSRANSPFASPRARSPVSSRRNSFSKENSSQSLAPSTIRAVPPIERQSSTDSVEIAPSARPQSNLRITSYAYEEERMSGASIPVKASPAVRVASGARLQPSFAQLNGKVNHSTAVNMSLEVPPSPSGPSFHASAVSTPKASSPEPKASFEYPSPQEQRSTRHSPTSSESSQNHSQLAHYVPEPPRLPLTDNIGRAVYERENPALAVKSHRASMISNGTYSSNRYSMTLPPNDMPTVPSLPAFPARAVIDSSHSRFNDFVKERSPDQWQEDTVPPMIHKPRTSSFGRSGHKPRTPSWGTHGMHKPRTPSFGTPITANTSRPRMSSITIPEVDAAHFKGISVQPVLTTRTSTASLHMPNEESIVKSPYEANSDVLPEFTFPPALHVDGIGAFDDDESATHSIIGDYTNDDDDYAPHDRPNSRGTSFSFAHTDPEYTRQDDWRPPSPPPPLPQTRKIGEAVPMSSISRQGLKRPTVTSPLAVGVYRPVNAF